MREIVLQLKAPRGTVHGSLLTKSAFCSAIMSSEAFCRTCLFHSKAKPDGTVEWTLAFSGREALNELLDHLKAEQVDVKIMRLSSVADVQSLTEHQKNLVETALEEGFFDYPRRITLRELAKKMGVSASSASEVLRRAERKILAGYQKRDAVQRFDDADEEAPKNKIFKGRKS